MSRFTACHLREFPAKTYHREDGSATLGIGILQHGCLAGLVLKNLLELGKLFKNPRCQAGWNKNVLFGFS